MGVHADSANGSFDWYTRSMGSGGVLEALVLMLYIFVRILFVH